MRSQKTHTLYTTETTFKTASTVGVKRIINIMKQTENENKNTPLFFYPNPLKLGHFSLLPTGRTYQNCNCTNSKNISKINYKLRLQPTIVKIIDLITPNSS